MISVSERRRERAGWLVQVVQFDSLNLSDVEALFNYNNRYSRVTVAVVVTKYWLFAYNIYIYLYFFTWFSYKVEVIFVLHSQVCTQLSSRCDECEMQTLSLETGRDQARSMTLMMIPLTRKGCVYFDESVKYSAINGHYKLLVKCCYCCHCKLLDISSLCTRWWTVIVKNWCEKKMCKKSGRGKKTVSRVMIQFNGFEYKVTGDSVKGANCQVYRSLCLSFLFFFIFSRVDIRYQWALADNFVLLLVDCLVDTVDVTSFDYCKVKHF